MLRWLVSRCVKAMDQYSTNSILPVRCSWVITPEEVRVVKQLTLRNPVEVHVRHHSLKLVLVDNLLIVLDRVVIILCLVCINFRWLIWLKFCLQIDVWWCHMSIYVLRLVIMMALSLIGNQAWTLYCFLRSTIHDNVWTTHRSLWIDRHFTTAFIPMQMRFKLINCALVL
jgi:hypothetical protein